MTKNRGEWKWIPVTGHSDNRLLKKIDHSGCLALYNFNILDRSKSVKCLDPQNLV